MEALFASLVSKYGFEMAAKILGLDKQTQNPKYTFGLPFTGKQVSFNPLQTLGRFGLNKVMSSGSGIMGPALLLGGAVMLGQAFNPLNPNSRNYKPGLRQEIDFATNRGLIDRTSTGLKYNTDSVLSGQNVVSMFGTNSYLGQLEKKKDYFEDRLEKGKSINESKYAQTLNEISEAKGFTQDKARTKNYGPYSGGGGNNNGGGNISGSVSRGGTDDTPGTPFRRGGIASL
tara:strand:- start:169 stop:858 length:690 start_codon:yes stop_codon:yes gene_type:complete